MRISGVVGAALLIVAAAAGLHAADEPGTGIPFRLYKGYLIMVKGSIGSLQNLDCIIDTGVSSTLISPRLARRLRLAGKARQGSAYGENIRVERVIIDNLMLGTTEFRRVPAFVSNLSSLPSRVRDVDVLVGLSILRRLPFLIDFQTRELVFGTAAPLPSSSPFHSKEHLVVELEVEGQRLNLLIDTGARDLILFRKRVKPFARKLIPTNVTRTLEHAGGSVSANMFKLAAARLGESQWVHLEVWVIPGSGSGYAPDVHGVLGIKALDLDRLSLDFRQQILRWER